MLHCGLLGEKLGHSYSPVLHGMLSDYEYRLFEKTREELPGFLKSGSFDGLNVTIPYKKEVIPFCAELSPLAASIGSVNTIVRRPDGTLFGDNTDAWGFEYMTRHAGIDVAGAKCLVFGNGGASVTVVAVLRSMGAGSVTVISRRGEDNYENLRERHSDADILVNTTPLGMYPKAGVMAADPADFPRCRGVLDIVYNPRRTALLLRAEELGIPHAGGLTMLVAQAKRASELFTGKSIPDSEVDRIDREMSVSMQNIVLVGMPGCGKSTISTLLSEELGRRAADSDALVAETAGCTIPEIFAAEGEEGFRRRETEALRTLGAASGTILATGGGAVTREENYPLLHQNGIIIWLKRDIDGLPTEGRPLSQTRNLRDMYRVREPMYRRFADWEIDNNGTPEETVKLIREALTK